MKPKVIFFVLALMMAAPYITAQLSPVGTAGSAVWSFFLDCPLWFWDGKTFQEAHGEVTDTVLEVTADGNAAFTGAVDTSGCLSYSAHPSA